MGSWSFLKEFLILNFDNFWSEWMKIPFSRMPRDTLMGSYINDNLGRQDTEIAIILATHLISFVSFFQNILYLAQREIKIIDNPQPWRIYKFSPLRPKLKRVQNNTNNETSRSVGSISSHVGRTDIISICPKSVYFPHFWIVDLQLP